MTTTILSLQAHPDDAEILCGGTLAKLASLGHHVVIATMTPGDCGSREYGPEGIAAVRRAEAAHAASLIGADYRCAEFRDLAIFNDDDARRRIVEVLRRVDPHVVITNSPVDYMCDHENTSSIVRDACFIASGPNYRTGAASPAPPATAIPHLYFADPVGGVDRDNRFVPADFYVDVSPFFALKRDMTAAHKSQREWLLKHHGVDDYMNMMERATRERGRTAGCEFAEGFRQYRGHPYPQSPLLQELLCVA